MVAQTKDGFVYPEAGDNILALNTWFERQAESVQAFADGDMGLRVLHPSGVATPDATSELVQGNGALVFEGASSCSMDGVFNWQIWRNYLIKFEFYEVFADTSFGWRARAGSNDDSSGRYAYTRTRAYNANVGGGNQGGTAVVSNDNDDKTVISPPTLNGNYTTVYGSVELYRGKANTKPHGTFHSSVNAFFDIQDSNGSFVVDPTVDAFDGFTIFPITSTQFSGTVRVYAFN